MLKKKTTEPTEEVILHVTRTKEGIMVKGSISQSDLFQVILNLLSEVHPETWNMVQETYNIGRNLSFIFTPKEPTVKKGKK